MTNEPTPADPASIRAALGLPSVNVTAPRMRVSYGDDANQFGELFLPPGDGQVPVIVVIHGGAWRHRFDLELGTPLAADIAEHGVAAWNIESRRVGGGGGWPTTFEDVAAAVDALAGPVQAAAGNRLDLSRVVAIGHSSGGHLAAWVAARPKLPAGAPGAGPAVRLIGAVCQAAVLDLEDASRRGLVSGAVDDFMGGSAADLPDEYALASPAALLPIQVPIVCVHGDADPTAPIDQSEQFVAAATAAGGEARFIGLAGVRHFEVIDPGHPAWRVCLDEGLLLLGLPPASQ